MLRLERARGASVEVEVSVNGGLYIRWLQI